MPKPPSKYSFIIVSYFSSLVNDKNEKSLLISAMRRAGVDNAEYV
jgi:hypothetical protein